MIWPYLLFIPAYLIGMLPNSVYVAKLAGHDIYKEGSKNPGASNVARIAGWKWGSLAMLLDALKGFVPTLLCLILLPSVISEEETRVVAFICAVAAVIGHVAPIRRKGGKGIATTGGAVFALYPIAGIFIAAIWFLMMKVSKLPVISSLVSALVFSIYVSFFHSYTFEIFIVYGLVLLLVVRHLPNIKRLIKGDESKVLKNKTKDSQDPLEEP